MDAIDYKAVGLLQKDGRMTWSSLAEHLDLTPPAAADRVRRLEETGVITRYTAIVDHASLGTSLTAFIAVTLERHSHRAAFLKLVARLPQVLECHHTAGDDDFLLKVRCRGTDELETLLTERLKHGPTAVARTRTVIVLRTEKETLEVPLDGVPR